MENYRISLTFNSDIANEVLGETVDKIVDLAEQGAQYGTTNEISWYVSSGDEW